MWSKSFYGNTINLKQGYLVLICKIAWLQQLEDKNHQKQEEIFI